MNTSRITIRLAALALGSGALAAGLTGCQLTTDVSNSLQDAWDVTYELTATGGDGDTAASTIDDVEVLDRESRTEQAKTVSKGTVETDADGVWSHETLVVAGDTAAVSATAPEGSEVSCRILLDGHREIAAETSEPGGTVRCSVPTPEFD